MRASDRRTDFLYKDFQICLFHDTFREIVKGFIAKQNNAERFIRTVRNCSADVNDSLHLNLLSVAPVSSSSLSVSLLTHLK